MSARVAVACLAAVWCASTARAQFSLFTLQGGVEQPTPAAYDLGGAGPSETLTARFRIRNVSSSPATLSGLTVTGTGFKLASAPSLPATLPSQATVEFTVEFGAIDLGTYSAALVSDAISVLLTATVLPRLTYQDGSRTLGGAPVDFGAVERGASAAKRITVANLTPVALVIPAISVTGADFALKGSAPGGTTLPPQQAIGFDIEFRPSAAGARTGTLAIGDRSYLLTGTGTEPPLPRPRLVLDLAKPLSARQGTISVTFDAPAKLAGSGTVTLDFRPMTADAKDSAIAFSTGGRMASFTFAAGDTLARFGDLSVLGFATGTSAGTLTLTVELGGVTDRQTVTIDPAAVSITSSQAVRTAGGLEVTTIGFDNSRTLGALAFTFFDTAGSAIAPGALRVDAAADFRRYFASSDLGGTFSLNATFPVTGDATKVAGVEIEIGNGIGTAKTARIAF